jgi:hypothetical protein
VTAPTGPATLAEPFDPRMVIGGLRQQGSEDPVLFPIDQPPPLGEVRRCRVGVARQRSLGVIALRAGEAKVVEAVPPTQGEWDHMIDRPRPLARDEVTPAVPALVAIPSDQAFQCDGPPLTATKPTRHGTTLNPGCDSGHTTDLSPSVWQFRRLAVRQIASQRRAQIRFPGFSGRPGRVAMAPGPTRRQPVTPDVNPKGTSPVSS